jgi:N-acetylneuraminic acid mutarotase
MNNQIYILSDTISHSKLDKSAVFEEYDPQNNTFKRLALLSPSRCDATMVSSNGKIYIIGGWNYGSISSVDEYDPVMDKWEKKTDMPFPIQNHQAVTVNNEIYITGGITYAINGSNEKKVKMLVYYPKIK